MAYTKTTWNNDAPPAINAENLNKIEQGIYDNDQNKVDKVSGKGLSQNDFTDALKTKLDGIEAQANKTVVDSALSDSSTNPVQNKAITAEITDLKEDSSETTRNLFDGKYGSFVYMGLDNGKVKNTEADGRTTFFAGVKLMNGTTAVDSATVKVISTVGRCNFVITASGNGDNIEIYHSGSQKNLRFTIPFNIVSGTTYAISFDVEGYNPSAVGGLIISKIQLEIGSTVTPYVPHITAVDYIARADLVESNNNIANLETASLKLFKEVYSIKTDDLVEGFIASNGTITSNAVYRTTDYIPIKSGDKLEYTLSHGTTLPIIGFYDTSKTYDSTKSVLAETYGYKSGTYTATANGYIRLCYATGYPNVNVRFTNEIPDNVKKYISGYVSTNEVPKMNILVLGDSIMGEDNDVTEPLSALSGANVINGAVGGTRATNRGGSDNFQYFDGVNLIQALCTNTWTDQETAVEALKTSYPWFPAKLETLESVDMSDIDMILFNWATNDYTGGVAMADIVSAHNTIINTIQTYYPSIRIVVVSPIWRYFDTEQDNKNADNFAYNVNTLKEISNAIIDNAHDKRITVFDAYKNMPLNYKTASTYFNSGSGVHLNAVGGKLFAHYINGFINSIC